MTVPTRTVTINIPNAGNGVVRFTLLDMIIYQDEVYQPGDYIDIRLGFLGDGTCKLWMPDEDGSLAVRYRVTLPGGGAYRISASNGDNTTLAAMLAAGETELGADTVTQLVASLTNLVSGVDTTLDTLLTNVDMARLSSYTSTSAVLTRMPDTARVGSHVLIGTGQTTAELRRISTIVGSTITWSGALEFSHSANEIVMIFDGAMTMPGWFGAVGDGITNDGDALRAWAWQHTQLQSLYGYDGLMYAPDGTYIVDLAPHPDNPAIPVGFWSNNLMGQSRDGTVFKLDDAQALFGTKSPYIVGNYEVGTSTTVGTSFSTFTLDGNALNQIGMGWSEMSGVKLTRTYEARVDHVLSKNVYSTGHSPDSEGFAIKFSIGADGVVHACITDNDDESGYESSGLSMSSCVNMLISDCVSRNSPQGNCITANKCWQLHYVNCIAQKTSDIEERTGFNCENCHYVVYTACVAGGYANSYINVDQYELSEDLGCRVGWVINSSSTNVILSACQSVSTTIGIIVKGSSTNIVIDGNLFYNADKGIRVDVSDGVDPALVYVSPSNRFISTITSDVSMNGGFGSVSWRGYNTPTLAASGSVNTNPFPCNMLICLSGGTITEVSVKSAKGNNYRPVGTGPGTYPIPHGASFKVTYSSTPAMYALVGVL